MMFSPMLLRFSLLALVLGQSARDSVGDGGSVTDTSGNAGRTAGNDDSGGPVTDTSGNAGRASGGSGDSTTEEEEEQTGAGARGSDKDDGEVNPNAAKLSMGPIIA